MLFSFTITFDSDINDLEVLADKLYDNGCDDALVGRFCNHFEISFDRESPNLTMALSSAFRDLSDVVVDLISVHFDKQISLKDLKCHIGKM